MHRDGQYLGKEGKSEEDGLVEYHCRKKGPKVKLAYPILCHSAILSLVGQACFSYMETQDYSEAYSWLNCKYTDKQG